MENILITDAKDYFTYGIIAGGLTLMLFMLGSWARGLGFIQPVIIYVLLPISAILFLMAIVNFFRHGGMERPSEGLSFTSRYSEEATDLSGLEIVDPDAPMVGPERCVACDRRLARTTRVKGLDKCIDCRNK